MKNTKKKQVEVQKTTPDELNRVSSEKTFKLEFWVQIVLVLFLLKFNLLITLLRIPLPVSFLLILFAIYLILKTPGVDSIIEKPWVKSVSLVSVVVVIYLGSLVSSNYISTIFRAPAGLLPHATIYFTVVYLLEFIAVKLYILNIVSLGFLLINLKKIRGRLWLSLCLLTNAFAVNYLVGGYCESQSNYDYPAVKIIAEKADFSFHDCSNIPKTQKVLFTGDGNAVVVMLGYNKAAWTICDVDRELKVVDSRIDLKELEEAMRHFDVKTTEKSQSYSRTIKESGLLNSITK